MRLLFSVTLLIWLISGCATLPRPRLPVLTKSEPVMFASEGMILKGVQGEFVDFETWQNIQNQSINNRLKANSCIELIEKYNNSNK